MSIKRTRWVTTAAGKEGGHIKYLYGNRKLDSGIIMECDSNYALSRFNYDILSQDQQAFDPIIDQERLAFDPKIPTQGGRNFGPKIGYSYKCNRILGLADKPLIIKKTPSTNVDAGGVDILSNPSLNVDCGTFPLVSTILRSDNRGNVYYEYDCGSKELINPVKKQTEYHPSGDLENYPTFNLFNHNLDCGNKFLTSFGIDMNDDKTQYRYNYGCAENEDPGISLFSSIVLIVVAILFILFIISLFAWGIMIALVIGGISILISIIVSIGYAIVGLFSNK